MKKLKKIPKKEKNNRRNRIKYPALRPNMNLRTRYEELIDFDYFHKLNDKEKDFMNRFLEEHVNANFKHGGKILHKTKEQKKACYDRNNARNRDIVSRSKASGKFSYLIDIKEEANKDEHIEDKILFKIDEEKNRK